MSILNNVQVVDRTAAIEKIPSKPTLMRSLNLYRAENVTTDNVQFDVKENQIRVLDDHLRNVDKTNSTEDTGFDIHLLPVPHYPLQKAVGRQKLSGVRGFGRDTEVAIAQAVADELATFSETFDWHEEYLISQMTLNGVVDTVHYGTIDMAEEFGVTRPTQELDVTGDIALSMRQAQKASRDNLNGNAQGFIAFVGPEMFEAILANEGVRDVLKYRGAATPVMNEISQIGLYNTFQIGNTLFIEYDQSFETKSGSVEILAPESGILVPRTRLGRTFYAPASTLSGLGKPGSRRFVRQYRDVKDRYIELDAEMNALVVNEQYGATVELSLPTS